MGITYSALESEFGCMLQLVRDGIPDHIVDLKFDDRDGGESGENITLDVSPVWFAHVTINDLWMFERKLINLRYIYGIYGRFKKFYVPERFANLPFVVKAPMRGVLSISRKMEIPESEAVFEIIMNSLISYQITKAIEPYEIEA